MPAVEHKVNNEVNKGKMCPAAAGEESAASQEGSVDRLRRTRPGVDRARILPVARARSRCLPHAAVAIRFALSTRVRTATSLQGHSVQGTWFWKGHDGGGEFMGMINSRYDQR